MCKKTAYKSLHYPVTQGLCTSIFCTSAQIPHTNYQARWRRGDDFGLFCSQSTWALSGP